MVSSIFPCTSGNFSNSLVVQKQVTTISLSGASSGRLFELHFVLCKKDKVDLIPFHLSYIIELMLCVINVCSVLNPPVQSSGKHIIMFTALKYNYCTTVCFTDNYFNPIKCSNSALTMLRTACPIYMQFCVQYHVLKLHGKGYGGWDCGWVVLHV